MRTSKSKIKQKIVAVLLLLSWILATPVYGNGSSQENNELAKALQRAKVINADTGKFDVIVIGGEPEGIAAAVAAARNGSKVLLIEKGEELGGLMTLGRLNFLDMSYGPSQELLTRGIFAEFYEKVGNAFEIAEAKEYFTKLVQKEKNIVLKLETDFMEPIMADSIIIGIKVKEKGESKAYFAARIIDATVDADVAAASGVPYTVGAEDYGRKEEIMGVTLVFRLKKVNWFFVFIYNNFMRLLSKIKAGWGDPFAGATSKVAWGYGEQALEYQPQDKMMRFRGPNLARQEDGTVLVNALLIFGVDGLQPDSLKEGIARGKKELPHIIKFMQKRFSGFARAELVDVAERLYVRETRHIEGEYRLTITDVLENRDHWDRIAHGSYPVDIQPTAPDNLGNVIGKPAIYSIPFRCLIPLKVENLLVVGRSASYDSLAHGSARVIPVGMATGEAAGVAAAYSLEKGLGFRELSKSKEAVAEVQRRLKSQGAYLVSYISPKTEVMNHWTYPGLKIIRELGLAAGGYSNDYHLDTFINHWDAAYVINQTLERTKDINGQKTMFPENINCGHLFVEVVRALSGCEYSPEDAYEFLLEKHFLTGQEAKHFSDLTKRPTFGELYFLSAVIVKNVAENAKN